MNSLNHVNQFSVSELTEKLRQVFGGMSFDEFGQKLVEDGGNEMKIRDITLKLIKKLFFGYIIYKVSVGIFKGWVS